MSEHSETEFNECAWCTQRREGVELCGGCIYNRIAISKLKAELAELKRQNEITESINTQMAIQIKSLKQERSLFTSLVFKKGKKSVPNFDTEEECLAWLDHFTPPQEAE